MIRWTGQFEFPFPGSLTSTFLVQGVVLRCMHMEGTDYMVSSGTPKPLTLNSNPLPLTPKPPTLNHKPSTLNPQPSTLNPKLSTLKQVLDGHVQHDG